MLLALTCLALFGLWWLGRNGDRLPAGMTPKRLVGFVLIAFAALLLLRGSLFLALVAAGAAAYLLLGKHGLLERLRSLAPERSARPPQFERTVLLEPERNANGAPLDALILAGPQVGFRLSQLDEPDLLALLALCRGSDPDGARFLEAYLDRRQPGGRVDADRDADARTGSPFQPGAMTEEEAYQLLGLERGASLDQIRAAHRMLMKRVHPDQGGSDEAAARLNAARDRLTNRHR